MHTRSILCISVHSCAINSYIKVWHSLFQSELSRARSNACTCMRMHAYACICMHMNAYECICMHTNAFACIRMHMHAFACTGMRLHVFACLCMHMHAQLKIKYIHIVRYQCTWIHIHVYSHEIAQGYRTSSGSHQYWSLSRRVCLNKLPVEVNPRVQYL